MQYSHSRLSAYENCPKQYRYRYVDKIETGVEGVEAFLGKRVHEVLERLYHHVRRHGQPPSLAQVQTRFRQDWKYYWHERVRIVRVENPVDFYLEQGERCLSNYYRSHYPFDHEDTIAVEWNVAFQLDPAGRYRMRGIVDRLVRLGDGRYEIHDYKTTGSLPPRSRLERDRQLALYQIGLEQTYPDAGQVDLIWHFLSFNRTERAHRTRQQLDALRAELIERIDEVEAASEFPARPGPLCRWCEFWDLCPEGGATAASGDTAGMADAAESERVPGAETASRSGTVRRRQLTLF